MHRPVSDAGARAADLWCWRHPPARGASGRCIGRTDLRVDPRKAKRLAHRIRRNARQHALLHVPPGRQQLPAQAWPAPPRHGSLTRALRPGR